MESHKFRIESPTGWGDDCRVLMDGQELKNVRSFSIDASVEDFVVLTITFAVVSVDVDGNFQVGEEEWQNISLRMTAKS